MRWIVPEGVTEFHLALCSGTAQALKAKAMDYDQSWGSKQTHSLLTFLSFSQWALNWK